MGGFAARNVEVQVKKHVEGLGMRRVRTTDGMDGYVQDDAITK